MLNLKHNLGINFAISSNQNPSSSEVLLSIQASTGITINTSAHIENNLTIGGILMVGSTDILSAITDLQNNPSGSSNVDLTNYYNKTDSDTRYYTKTQSDTNLNNYVLKTGSTMSGNLTVDGTTNFKQACTVSGGRGREGTGSWMNLIGTGDSTYNTSALSFGCANVETHVMELSWKGLEHWMRPNASSAWYDTMGIESSGRWKFTTGLLVIGTCLATVYSTSDARIKDDVQNLTEKDAIILLKNVSPKTYIRKDTPGKRRAGFIAQDFFKCAFIIR